MLSFKGILKYIIIIFIAVWMFVLGIVVGRGNSPITFDTQGFERQLKNIAGELLNKESEKKQINLEFFEVLDQPVAEEKSLPKVLFPKSVPSLKSVPGPKNDSKVEIQSISETIPIKTSTKKRTFQKKIKASRPIKALSVPVVSVKKKKGRYTIQIAAYKNFTDAVTRMANLEEKGITSYREKSEKDGITWYRVRTGDFYYFEDAKKFKGKLNRIKIKAMIIKKDNDEDIKG
ncbi:MAG: SPOR domain-containing protein [Desulfobacula sp.]|nr:SPOR domain-containing protein [Desulfobacula sp.]